MSAEDYYDPKNDEFRARIAAFNRQAAGAVDLHSTTIPLDENLKTTASVAIPKGQAVKFTAPESGEVGVQLDDFCAYMPTHNYIFKPTREMWPASSVNARIPPIATEPGVPPLKANQWLDANRAVEQATWAPGLPMQIKDRLIDGGGWIDHPACTVFNLYRPPGIRPKPGDPGPWVKHVRRLYGDGAEHIITCLAHRVQRPFEKINHAIVLGGAQGIGKDTILEPIKHAIGPWNFTEVGPMQMLGRFNGFVKSVILRMNEARDLGEFDRYSFYEHTKAYIAAPPDVLRVDEKHLREHYVTNVALVIITTNHKTNGIYLPADDRRHFVAWSTLRKEEFDEAYWTALYDWYQGGGNEIIAHYLLNLDIADFNPKTPPPKTQAFWEIVDASRAPEDAEMADALDGLGRPDAVTLNQIKNSTNSAEFSEWLSDRRNSRIIPFRMEECDYLPVRNDGAKDGLWKLSGRRQVIYAKRELSERDRVVAARKVAGVIQ